MHKEVAAEDRTHSGYSGQDNHLEEVRELEERYNSGDIQHYGGDHLSVVDEPGAFECAEWSVNHE